MGSEQPTNVNNDRIKMLFDGSLKKFKHSRSILYKITTFHNIKKSRCQYLSEELSNYKQERKSLNERDR